MPRWPSKTKETVSDSRPAYKPEVQHTPVEKPTEKQGETVRVNLTPKYTKPQNPKWTLADPKISARNPSVWRSVFKCTNPKPLDAAGNPCSPHKTKATNMTPASEVPCHLCGWPTETQAIFNTPPVNYRLLRVQEPTSGEFTDA